MNTCKFLQTESRNRRPFSRPDVIINIDVKGYFTSKNATKMFLRVFMYKKLIQVKFYCVISGRNENFVKDSTTDKWFINCILQIAFKCQEWIVSGLKSHQPITTFIIQEYQPLLKICRKISLIRSRCKQRRYRRFK